MKRKQEEKYIIKKTIYKIYKKKTEEMEIKHLEDEKEKKSMKKINNKMGKLIEACINGNTKELDSIISTIDNENLDMLVDGNGWSLLHIGVIKNKLKIVNYLLENGMDVNIKNIDNGYTPFHIACQNNSKPILEILMQHGADKNAKTNDDHSGIEIACSNNNNEIVKYLLDNNVDVRLDTNKEYKLLHIAVVNNNLL